MSQAAHRLGQLDHLLEGNVLMLLRGERLRLGLLEQFAHSGRTGQVQAQRQGVDEEADQVLDLGPSPVGRRRADNHILLAGEPRQQCSPTGQKGHEQGRAMPLAQLPQPGCQLLVQHQPREGPGIVLLGRTGMIGGQLQQRRGSRQRVLPVGGLLLQDIALDPFPLPDSVVGILNLQLRQGIGFAPQKRAIQHTQFVDQHTHRPAVGDNMVHGDQQRVLILGQPDQPAPDQRTVLRDRKRRRLPAR